MQNDSFHAYPNDDGNESLIDPFHKIIPLDQQFTILQRFQKLLQSISAKIILNPSISYLSTSIQPSIKSLESSIISIEANIR